MHVTYKQNSNPNNTQESNAVPVFVQSRTQSMLRAAMMMVVVATGARLRLSGLLPILERLCDDGWV